MDIQERIRIASPCSVDWNQMYGDDKQRFCKDCSLNVYYLPGMSSQEVESFILRSEGRVCVRLYERADGTLITEDCPVGLSAARLRVRRIATAAASVVVSFFIGLGSGRLLNGPDSARSPVPELPPSPTKQEAKPKIEFGGMISNLHEIKAEILRDQERA